MLFHSTSTPLVNQECQELIQESQESILSLNRGHVTISSNNSIESTDLSTLSDPSSKLPKS